MKFSKTTLLLLGLLVFPACSAHSFERQVGPTTGDDTMSQCLVLYDTHDCSATGLPAAFATNCCDGVENKFHGCPTFSCDCAAGEYVKIIDVGKCKTCECASAAGCCTAIKSWMNFLCVDHQSKDECMAVKSNNPINPVDMCQWGCSSGTANVEGEKQVSSTTCTCYEYDPDGRTSYCQMSDGRCPRYEAFSGDPCPTGSQKCEKSKHSFERHVGDDVWTYPVICDRHDCMDGCLLDDVCRPHSQNVNSVTCGERSGVWCPASREPIIDCVKSDTVPNERGCRCNLAEDEHDCNKDEFCLTTGNCSLGPKTIQSRLSHALKRRESKIGHRLKRRESEIGHRLKRRESKIGHRLKRRESRLSHALKRTKSKIELRLSQLHRLKRIEYKLALWGRYGGRESKMGHRLKRRESKMGHHYG